jgi:predicted DNA-binding transcriptional regulator AlpA
MNADNKLLGQREVWEYLGITRAGFYKLRKTTKDFPKPVKVLSLDKWKRGEIDEYLEQTRKRSDEYAKKRKE